MEIAFFTEMGFNGKVPRTHDNMRTEFAWMVALNADHYNIKEVPNKKYDLGITIIPKNITKALQLLIIPMIMTTQGSLNLNT